MELRDLIVTPVILILVFWGAYIVRPWVTDEVTRKYFFPALWIRVAGALALGFLYQFYYNGGDTFNYHTHGSRHLWEGFIESPSNGFRAFFANGTYGPGLWEIAENIWYWRDPHAFMVIRIATIFDFVTFSSYSGTAVLFSVLSFTGAWMMFLTFYNRHPGGHRILAISCLFIPSVIFWGSGILKDTVTLAFAGVATYYVAKIFIDRDITITGVVILFVSFFFIYTIKKYILITLIAALIAWIAFVYFFSIESKVKRILMVPLVVMACVGFSYLAISGVVNDDKKYSLDRIAETARITSWDIRYGWGSGAGSGYSIGELDGSIGSMLKSAPSAINVSLFRPYLWEVKNPIMLLSALESLLTLFITLYFVFKIRNDFFLHLKGDVIFCLLFALVFAFGVGISTGNFGTLARYKIPLLPYYLTGLGLIYYQWKRDRKRSLLELTE